MSMSATSKPAPVTADNDPAPSAGFQSAQANEVIPIDHEILRADKLEVIAIGASGYVYKCPQLVYKMNARQREFDFMKAAGDCAIAPVCRITR